MAKNEPQTTIAPAPEAPAAPARRGIELIADHAEHKRGATFLIVPNDQPYAVDEVTEHIAQKLVKTARVAKYVDITG